MKIRWKFRGAFFLNFLCFFFFYIVSWYFICIYVFHDQILTNVQRLFSFVPTFLRYFLFLYLFTFFNDVGDETVILSCNRILGKWTRTIPNTCPFVRANEQKFTSVQCAFLLRITHALYQRVCTRVWLKGGAISKGKGKIAGIAKVD